MEKEQKQLIQQNENGAFILISDLVIDEIFIENVKKEISILREERISRPQPKAGYSYKRDWYDRMTDDGTFNANYFLENIEQIWLKKSSISSVVRSIIEHVCGNAYVKTLQHYQKQAPDV